MTTERKIVATKEFDVNVMYVESGHLTAARTVVKITSSRGGSIDDVKDNILESIRTTIFGMMDDDIEYGSDGMVDLEHEVLPKTRILQVKRLENNYTKDCIFCAIGAHLSTEIIQIDVQLVHDIDEPDLITIPAIFVQRVGIQTQYHATILVTDMKMNVLTSSKLVFLRGFSGIHNPEPEYYFHDARVIHLPGGHSDIEAMSLFIERSGYIDDALIEVVPLCD